MSIVIALVLAMATILADPTEEEATIALRRADVQVSATVVTFANIEAPDEATVKSLAALPKLRQVIIWGQDVDVILKRLPELPAVESLSIEQAKIGDDALKSLAKMPNLKRLTISDAPIGDKSLVHLHKHLKLEALRINKTHVTKNGLKELYKKLPKCVGELD